MSKMNELLHTMTTKHWNVTYPNGTKDTITTIHDGNIFDHLEQLKECVLGEMDIQEVFGGVKS